MKPHLAGDGVASVSSSPGGQEHVAQGAGNTQGPAWIRRTGVTRPGTAKQGKISRADFSQPDWRRGTSCGICT